MKVEDDTRGFINACLTQHKMLAISWEAALQRGFEVTFKGNYHQGRLKSPDEEYFTPFVIGQDARQKELLETGRLSGAVFEIVGCLRIANIEGEIDKREVSFNKTYPNVIINRSPILYLGNSEKGILYRGTWSFPPNVTEDMCTEGTFHIQRIMRKREHR